MMNNDSEQSRPTRFRWRTIPVGIIGGFGAIYLAAAVGLLALMTYTTISGKPLYEPGPSGFTKEGLFALAICAPIGALLLIASIQWWRGRWRLALVIIAAIVAVYQLLAAFGMMPE